MLEEEIRLEGLDLRIYNHLKTNGALDRESLFNALKIARTTCFEHLNKLLKLKLVIKFSKPTLKRGKPPTLWCLKKDKERYFIEHPYKKPIFDLLEKYEILSTPEICEKLHNLKEVSIRNALKKCEYDNLLGSFWRYHRIYWYSKENNSNTKEYYLNLLQSSRTN